jgi:hypothetical protein
VRYGVSRIRNPEICRGRDAVRLVRHARLPETEYHGRLPSNVIVNFVGLKINLKLLWEQLSSKPKA